MSKVTPRKRFGQNFLQSNHVIEQIASLIAPQANDRIVEIGPGLGALTKMLLPQVTKFDAIEIDRDLIPELKKNCEGLGQLTVHEADALAFDFSSLAPEQLAFRLIGNLPYNISTPLIFHVLNYREYIQDMHFMLQKEVVDRMVAEPGNKQYGRLSVMTQYYCRAEKLLKVDPSAFFPPPKVDSAIVRLTPKTQLNATSDEQLSTLVKQAFQQRRKTLANNLKGMISTEQLTALDIDPKQRPEQLSVQDYVKISNELVG
jgi:16S rRNA (adenine1518-N6/adenine1519-N6)-dimethyltransferase